MIHPVVNEESCLLEGEKKRTEGLSKMAKIAKEKRNAR
jgi:hypothetical protein